MCVQNIQFRITVLYYRSPGEFADVPALLSSQNGKENERRRRLKRETRVIAVGKCRKNFRVLKHVQINRAIKQNDNFKKYCHKMSSSAKTKECNFKVKKWDCR